MIKRKINHLKAIIICHGKSEFILTHSLKSNLRLNVKIDSKDNGESSIQLTSLINFLDKKGYKDSKTIIKNNDSIEHKKNKMINFKIFIIIDLDEEELTEEMIKSYKDKSMFSKYDYSENIVPIFNDKNLDSVLINLGYEIDIKHKARSYKKIFPGINGDYNEFLKIKSKIGTSKRSNMIEMLEYLDKCIGD